MDSYLGNLAAAATQEKDMLEKLVTNSTNLITQLVALTNKFEQLPSQDYSSSSSGTPILNGKKMKFVQYDKNGYCHTYGYRCEKNHSSRACSKPRPNDKKDSTR